MYGEFDGINIYCDDKDSNKHFEAINYCEMYCLFEQCRKEMYKLMKYTLNRFVKTNQFLSLNKQ